MSVHERRLWLRRVSRRDDAATEVLGSLLAIGIVVSLVAVAMSRAPGPDSPPPTDLQYLVEAHPGDDGLILTHTGGANVDAGSVEVLVVVDSVEWYRGPLGGIGTAWRLGDDVLIGPLPQPLPALGRIDVSLIRLTSNGAEALAPSNRYDLAVFERPLETPRPLVGIAFANSLDHTSAQGTDTLFVQATVDHPEGRKLIRTVEGRIEGINTPWATMRDDGTRGDPVAGDGYYTAELAIPVNVPAGTYVLTVMAEDLYGNRVIATGSVEIAPRTLAAPSTPEVPASPPPPVLRPPVPPFLIDPKGGVRPACDGPFQMVVVGTDITYGATGPHIPVYVDLTLDGATISPLFGGAQVRGGETYTHALVTPSMTLGARGLADGFGFRHAYNSYTDDPHVRVLTDGDAVPKVAAYGTQLPVEQHLAPYVRNGHISLAYNEIIVLYEFNPRLDVEAADFQDLVLLFRFPAGTCPS